MGTTINTLECKTGATTRGDRRRMCLYGEDAPQLASRFGAKSLSGKGQLCWYLQKGGV